MKLIADREGMMSEVKKDTLFRVGTCAHALDDDFVEEIRTKYGVVIVEDSDAPWEVIFEGSKQALEQMLDDLWDRQESSDVYNILSVTEWTKNEVTRELRDQCRQLSKEGKHLEAVRKYRGHTGLSLVDAKEAVLLPGARNINFAELGDE